MSMSMVTCIDVAESEQDLYRKMWTHQIVTVNKTQDHYVESLRDKENRVLSGSQ